MNPSPNLFLIGPTGAGKTSLGRQLAACYRLPFVDLDRAIEVDTGVAVATIFEIEGEAGFRAREQALLHRHAETADGIVLATGAGAVLAAANRQVLAGSGFVAWLDVTLEEQLRRLADNHQRPLLAGADRQNRLQEMARVRTPLYEATADLCFHTRREDVATAARRARRLLDAHWQHRFPSNP